MAQNTSNPSSQRPTHNLPAAKVTSKSTSKSTKTRNKKRSTPDGENNLTHNPVKHLKENINTIPLSGSNGTNTGENPDESRLELSISIDEIMNKYAELKGQLVILTIPKDTHMNYC
jgi:hypothetical protein